MPGLPTSRHSPYNLKELDAGCIVELEHTKNKGKACGIAKQHLEEDHKYYSKLCSIWPKEKGCEYVRLSSMPYRYWPWAAVVVGGLFVWGAVKSK